MQSTGQFIKPPVAPIQRRFVSAAVPFGGMLLAALLAACGGESTAPPAQTTATPPSAPEAPAVVAPSVPAEMSVEQLLRQAQQALADGRRFQPPGNNAVEYYLRIIELSEQAPVQSEPESKRRLFDALSDQSPADTARAAIRDLVPLGLMRVEGALSESNWDEAEQVLQALRVTGQAAETVARLQQRLATAREAERQARLAAAQPRPVAAPVQPTITPPPASRAEPAPPATASTAAPSSTVPSGPSAAAVNPPTTTTPPVTSAPPPSVVEAPPQVARVEPRLLSSVAPRYPNQALRKRIEGFVEVRFVVQTDGSVDDVEVVAAEPSGWFEREAIQAARRWRFEPLAEPQPLQRVVTFRLD
ncbi:energy transducer TonB [Pseudomarimonas arenosa]|uniref:Protein TonB n=1 Tax=Pseudomarimonas arenosa TaxID=2774145 RepID=A0AAW3ZIN4_9GAMM|nr:energy transducer TonB [Pseudomarimonas arenosa]MBD8525856.1 energy transducer TonB [Pseudomarimonas arenosa]